MFTSFDHSPAPPHHFNPSGEELGNVTSIVLQLTRSNLESPFDGLLPYQDWPLVCWTYAHHLCLLKYANILSWLHTHTHRGECEGCSIPPACFFTSPPLSIYVFQKTHQLLPILLCFTQCEGRSIWCTILSISDGIFGHLVMKKVLPPPTKYLQTLSPHDDIKLIPPQPYWNLALFS